MNQQNTLTLKPSKLKWAGLGGMGFLLAAAGVGMMVSDAGWLGSIFVLLFGILLIAASLFVFFGDQAFILSPEGMKIVLRRKKSAFYNWSEIERFEAATVGGTATHVVFWLTPEARERRVKNPELQKIIARTVQVAGEAFTGQTLKNVEADGALADTYGYKPAKLAALLNGWKERARIGSKQTGAYSDF